MLQKVFWKLAAQKPFSAKFLPSGAEARIHFEHTTARLNLRKKSLAKEERYLSG
jgi:hypothetical protein